MEHFGTVWNILERLQGEQMQEELTTTETEKVEPIAIYQNNILALVDDVKQ